MAPESVPERPEAVVKARCDECGGGERNHVVVEQHSYDDGDENVQIYVHFDFQIIKCLGCGTFRFREAYTNSEDTDEDYRPVWRVRVFPETQNPLRVEQRDLSAIPGKVGGIYAETVTALNAGANTLAGGGLRAIVEAICLDQGVDGGNLQKKIDGLAEAGLLAKPQAELLHEQRFIGNAALHELESPSLEDLLDALEIVETLLRTIYVLPKKAQRMRERRRRRSKGLPEHEDPPF